MQIIWFTGSFLVLFSALFLVKKSEEKLNAVVWGIMMFLTVMCLHAVAAAVISLVKIPVNIGSIGLIDDVLGIILWVYIIKKKKRQRYELKAADLVSMAVLVLLVVFVAIQQFGTGLHLNYESADGTSHFRLALEVLQNQQVQRMFFAPLNNALFLEMFAPFVKGSSLYHVYLLADSFSFFLGGAVFFAVIRRRMDTWKSYALGMLITVLYLMGYPRNVLIYGFNYLGVAIILVLFLAWSMELYFEEKIPKSYAIVLLSLGTLSLGVCYSFFVPVVYVAIAVAIFRKQWHRRNTEKKSVLFKQAVIDNLKIFVIPTCVVLYYSFFSFFGTSNTGSAVASGLSSEGGAYRDLFSNFIFWAPFVIYAVIRIFQKKTEDVMLLNLVFTLCFMLVIGAEVVLGKASTYYYYKNYNLLAAIVFYLAFYGLSELLKTNWQMAVSYLGVYVLLLAASVSKIEARIQEKNELLVPIVKANYFFDIYETNQTLINGIENYDEDKLAMYQYCYDHFSQEDYKTTVFFGGVVDENVFRVISMRVAGASSIHLKCEEPEDLPDGVYVTYFENGYQRFKESYEDVQAEPSVPMIVMCQNTSDRETIKQECQAEWEVVFENECGFIATKK